MSDQTSSTDDACGETGATVVATPLKRSMGGRILQGLLLLILIGAFFGVRVWRKNSADTRKSQNQSYLRDLQQPLDEAADAVKSNVQVQAKLGESLTVDKESLTREGQGKELDRSNAGFQFSVVGSKGTGGVAARATFAAGNWKVTEVKVQLPDGSSVDVPPPAEKPPDLEFDVGADSK